jgi:hypothetical protein
MLNLDYDARIRELVGLLPVEMGPIVEQRCRENLRIYPAPERSAVRLNAGFHSYGPDHTVICAGKFGQVVFEEMLKDGACTAPTFSHLPIDTGKVETLWPFDDMVVKLVDRPRLSVYNVTLPKHMFFPGFVRLDVLEDTRKTSVAVSGKGTGNWRLPNTLFARDLFETILESHLVPRVERRIGPVRASRR